VFRFGVNFVLLVSLTPVKWWITVLRDFSRFFQFPIITDICIYLCNSLLFLPSLNLFSNSHLKMDTTFEKLKKYFPALPQNAITKIYRARCARLRLLMNHGIPEDIRWLIEVKVRLSGESSTSFISYNATCCSLGMISINREDKIQFIKDGLSKGSLDNLLLTLEMHPSGNVHRVIHDLWPQFHKEHDRLSLGNLTIKDPVCQFLRKLDGKPIPDP